MCSLPVARAEDKIENSHINAGILVKKKNRADLAVLVFADRLNATVYVLFGQKGNGEFFHIAAPLLDLNVSVFD